MRAALLATLLLLPSAYAAAQAPARPALTRHGDWVEGQISGGGRQGCVAGVQVLRRGLLQVTVGREPDGTTVLVLALRVEGANFTAGVPLRLTTDGRTFELPAQADPAGGPGLLVIAGTEAEARTLSDLLVAMRRGRELRVQAGDRTPFDLSLTGASAALGGMRGCAQRAGMMPR